MKHRKRSIVGKSLAADGSLPPSSVPEKPETAFDLWLERGLHKLFDEVASEPIPPELLQLIEGSRSDTDAEDRDTGDTGSEAD